MQYARHRQRNGEYHTLSHPSEFTRSPEVGGESATGHAVAIAHLERYITLPPCITGCSQRFTHCRNAHIAVGTDGLDSDQALVVATVARSLRGDYADLPGHPHHIRRKVCALPWLPWSPQGECTNLCCPRCQVTEHTADTGAREGTTHDSTISSSLTTPWQRPQDHLRLQGCCDDRGTGLSRSQVGNMQRCSSPFTNR